MTQSFKALGTTWWIEVFDEVDEKTLADAFSVSERFVKDFEDKYSRFKADSLISQLNTYRELLEPSEHLRLVLSYGKNLYLRTNTYFNVLTGHILETRGYDSDYSFTAKDETNLVAGNPISDLNISPEKITLTHGNLDIGGFGKGYLIDEVARLLKITFSLQYFLINAGGDMFATSENGKPIEIHLEHPVLEGVTIAKTTLLNQGFAASSPYKRRWKSNERVYTHVIGQSLTHHCSFVKHTTAAEADAFATVALLATSTEMERMSQTEDMGLAYFDPTTKKLTSNKLFSATKTAL